MQRRMLDACSDEPVPDASMHAPCFRGAPLGVFTPSSVGIIANDVTDPACFPDGSGFPAR